MMRQYNAKNERIKYHYFDWLEHSKKGYKLTTIRSIREALYRFDQFTGFKGYDRFDKDVAKAFKKHLLNTPSQQTGGVLSKSYVLQVSKFMMAFLEWLSQQPSYKGKVRFHEIEYLSLSREDKSIAAATTPRRWLTIEQIVKAIKSMPDRTPVDKRNRALISLLSLTGARISALISLKLKHIDLADKCIHQHPIAVKTKNRKRIRTYFFPIDNVCFEAINSYVEFLIREKGFSSDDPIFPRNKVAEPPVSVTELDCVHWKNTGSARNIIKGALASIGIQGYCPHSFRNSIVQLAYKKCRTPLQFKGWSTNLGHKNVITTFTSYGHIDEFKQGEIIKGFSNSVETDSDNDETSVLKKIASMIKQKGVQ